MAKYRKLGRTSSQRKALIRNQVTNLLYTEKSLPLRQEQRKSARSLRAHCNGVKEKDNYETVKVTAKVAEKTATARE